MSEVLSQRKQYELKSFLQKYEGDIVCLLETKVKLEKMQSLADTVFQGWSLLHNYSNDSSGRIWILFKSNLVVNLHSSTAQVMHCYVFHTCSREYFFLSCIYAANHYTERAELWRNLQLLKGCMDSSPWLLV